MGKRILGVIAFAAIAAVAGWNYQQNKQEVELSDLALENVEALAACEQTVGGTMNFSQNVVKEDGTDVHLVNKIR